MIVFHPGLQTYRFGILGSWGYSVTQLIVGRKAMGKSTLNMPTSKTTKGAGVAGGRSFSRLLRWHGTWPINSKSVRRQRRIDLKVLNLPVPKLSPKRPPGHFDDCFSSRIANLQIWDFVILGVLSDSTDRRSQGNGKIYAEHANF